jgi:demethylmenaquinone methyltransferase/2-methoxy-6-polyprenyl-1,4-benzoquinol methylase
LANLTGRDRADYVHDMFTGIAHRYDLMNRVMTAGQDIRWRKLVIQRAGLIPGNRVLDLGAGTGDLAREALYQCPNCFVVAADFTLSMMQVGKIRSGPGPDQRRYLEWAAADAQELPFPAETFDAVVSGFLLRNVSDIKQCLSEQFRVLKPGGKVISLDTTPPPDTLFKPVLQYYLHRVIPGIGRVLTGHNQAYEYLPDSTESFLQPEQTAERMMSVGFNDVGFSRLMFKTIAIHWALKQ